MKYNFIRSSPKMKKHSYETPKILCRVIVTQVSCKIEFRKSFLKRFMHKRTIIAITEVSKDAITSQLARGTLGALKTITNDTVILGLIRNNAKPFLEHALSYLNNTRDFTNLQIKGNLLSGVLNKPIMCNDVAEVHKNLYPENKLAIVPEGTMPMRGLLEVSLAKTFLSNHSDVINEITLTGDNILTQNKTQAHEDLLLKLSSSFGEKQVSMDIKLGNNMVKYGMSGTIGQVTYYEGNQVYVPNNIIDLVKYNQLRAKEINILKCDLRDNKFIMPTEQKEVLNGHLSTLEPLFQGITEDTIAKHIQIESILMKIQTLPSLPRRPGYLNIVTLETPRSLEAWEKTFVKEVTPLISNQIFKNQQSLNNFIRKALIIYKNEVDREAMQKVLQLKNTSWEFTFLDAIDITLF